MKLTPLGIDKSIAWKIISLQEFSSPKLRELLLIYKNSFILASYNRPPHAVELMAEYTCLLQLFDLSYYSTGLKSISLENLKANVLREYTISPRMFNTITDSSKLFTESEIQVHALLHLLDVAMLTLHDAEQILYSFFQLVDSGRSRSKFSDGRYMIGTSMLPRYAVSASPHQMHSPIRGVLSIGAILQRAGHQVGILSQRSPGSIRNQLEMPHFSLFIPPGTGHSFIAFLTVEKGRQNCMTVLILFLLIYYQSTMSTDPSASHSTLSVITRILAEIFNVAEIGSLKKVLSDLGLPNQSTSK